MHATLAAIAQGPKNRHCVKAAEAIMDRAFRKPEQTNRHEAQEPGLRRRRPDPLAHASDLMRSGTAAGSQIGS